MEEAKGLIDKIRVRAGIPTIDEAWKKANHPEKANTAEGLREIVRRERQIEFYLENQRFWDLRRWKDGNVLAEPIMGMNIYNNNITLKYEISKVEDRVFTGEHYYLPIPLSEQEKNPLLKE